MRHPLSAFVIVLISGSHSFPLFPQKQRPRIVITTSHARKILVAARPPPPPPFLLLSASSSSSSAQESGHDNDDDNNIADAASIIRKKLPLNMSMARPLTAIGASTSFVVSAVFFVVLAWQRDALMVSFFIGAISNGILSKVLKKIINQTRPVELETADLKLKPSDGHGMPSSHAMSLGFISTFTALQLPWTRVWLVLYVILSLVYRVQVNLHTWQQIAVGSIVGSCNGYAWFRLCTGDNPWNVRVLDFVAVHFLDDSGRLPLPMLLVPMLLGAAIVGSFERRIGAWLKKRKKEGKRDE